MTRDEAAEKAFLSSLENALAHGYDAQQAQSLARQSAERAGIAHDMEQGRQHFIERLNAELAAGTPAPEAQSIAHDAAREHLIRIGAGHLVLRPKGVGPR